MIGVVNWPGEIYMMHVSRMNSKKGKLLQFVLIGAALELLYLVVFALAPLSTINGHTSLLATAWPWTLAPSQFLFHVAWSASGEYTGGGIYYLLLGLVLIALCAIYLYAAVSAFRRRDKLHITSRWLNCVLIWAILGKIAPARCLPGTVLYAWNPLALVELAGNGHNDGLLICLLLLASWLLVQQRGGWYDAGAFAFTGLAISLNFVGLIFAPLFTWFSVRLALTRPANAAALAPIRLTNAAAQLPSGSGETQGELVLRTQAGRKENERDNVRVVWGCCWRALVTLITLLIVYLPFWHGGSTFVAISTSIDMQHFVHSLLAMVAVPLDWLSSHGAQGANVPANS